MFVLKDHDEIESIIAAFRTQHPLCFSNYYGLSDGDEYELNSFPSTILLRKKEHELYRVFFLTANNEELVSILNELPKKNYIFNIPSKQPIESEISMFASCGFVLIEEYNRYYIPNFQETYDKVTKFVNAFDEEDYQLALVANASDSSQILDLFSKTFSLNMDHVPTIDELKKMIAERTVFVNKTKEGEIFGVEIISIQGKKCYGNIRVDTKGMGIFLEKKIFDYMLEKGIKYHYFWIRKTNKQVVRYHKMLGAKWDGLSDYSFVN